MATLGLSKVGRLDAKTGSLRANIWAAAIYISQSQTRSLGSVGLPFRLVGFEFFSLKHKHKLMLILAGARIYKFDIDIVGTQGLTCTVGMLLFNHNWERREQGRKRFNIIINIWGSPIFPPKRKLLCLVSTMRHGTSTNELFTWLSLSPPHSVYEKFGAELNSFPYRTTVMWCHLTLQIMNDNAW